jgi:sulfoxide reductase heme-binding subunit YedZ
VIPHFDPHGPLLWYLTRGTGIVLLVLLTLTTCLGILAARADAGRRVPAFVSQGLHRTLSLTSVSLLVAHVTTSVVSPNVDIRLWQVFSPLGATYHPRWLGLGAVSLDLIAIVVVSSLLRARGSLRLWRNLHWLAYLAWAAGMVHAAGMGSDADTRWGLWTGVGCVAAVALSLLVRTLPRRGRRTAGQEPAARLPELVR